MTVGEMDGFVTGLLVCAQIVPPSEWLPVVWGPETEFESAMGLRPETWEQIKRNDEQDVTEAVKVIHALYAAANGTSELAEKGLDLLESMAPTLIGGMVRDLDARKQSRGPGAGERFVPGLPGATGEKAGRDEPCGCGSERRYDRCCGAH